MEIFPACARRVTALAAFGRTFALPRAKPSASITLTVPTRGRLSVDRAALPKVTSAAAAVVAVVAVVIVAAPVTVKRLVEVPAPCVTAPLAVDPVVLTLSAPATLVAKPT